MRPNTRMQKHMGFKQHEQYCDSGYCIESVLAMTILHGNRKEAANTVSPSQMVGGHAAKGTSPILIEMQRYEF